MPNKRVLTPEQALDTEPPLPHSKLWGITINKDKISWDDISFIERAKQRKAILSLLDRPKTPTQLKKESGLHFNAVSRALNELEKKDFVKCLTPQQKLGRFYELAKKGKEVLKCLQHQA